MVRRYYRNSRYRTNSIGYERAREHIRQAAMLSQELGGTDKDVKEYFFSLNQYQLKPILDEYESNYGQLPRDYAEKTLNKWRSGRVKMSGLVAERLFSLLPNYMPLQTKYQLTENLWEHVGTSSNKVYCIGIDTNINEVIDIVKQHLETVVIPYKIPEPMERRFNWLSQGDVDIKQKLLNHLREQEKKILAEVLSTKLPILTDHLSKESGKLTHHISEVLTVGKHDVRIVVDKNVIGITEESPYDSEELPYDSEESPYDSEESWFQNPILWWVIGIGILLYFLSHS